jgi:hypothetical protein
MKGDAALAKMKGAFARQQPVAQERLRPLETAALREIPIVQPCSGDRPDPSPRCQSAVGKYKLLHPEHLDLDPRLNPPAR